MAFRTEYWDDRLVLVTGHTGFKGAWLTHLLNALGARVIGYSVDVPTKPSIREFQTKATLEAEFYGDVRDQNQVEAILTQFQPSVVFHLAAQSLVRESYKNPHETFETNVMGTLAVLEAIRNQESVEACVSVTSDKVYLNREWVWPYRESDNLGGFDPYSASKACADILTRSYSASFLSEQERACKVYAVRAGNVIGGGDFAADRLVPDAVRAFSSSQPLVIRSPMAVRPWQHVLDPLAGYICLVEEGMGLTEAALEGAWNFGPSSTSTISVGGLVEALAKRWGGEASVDYQPQHEFHEAGLLQVDSSKAMNRLSWRPKIDLDGALDMTVDWYKAFYKGSNQVPNLMEKQVDWYLRAE